MTSEPSDLAAIVEKNKAVFVAPGNLVCVALVGVVILVRSHRTLRRAAASTERPSISLGEVVVADPSADRVQAKIHCGYRPLRPSPLDTYPAHSPPTKTDASNPRP
jgi:hypothetical protein